MEAREDCSRHDELRLKPATVGFDGRLPCHRLVIIIRASLELVLVARRGRRETRPRYEGLYRGDAADERTT